MIRKNFALTRALFLSFVCHISRSSGDREFIDSILL